MCCLTCELSGELECQLYLLLFIKQDIDSMTDGKNTLCNSDTHLRLKRIVSAVG